MKRDAATIKQQLQETKSNQLITKVPCIIEFPKRYVERNMAEIGIENYVFGIYALIMGDTYAVSVIPASIKTTPYRISEVERDGVVYYNFHYEAGNVLIENTYLVRRDVQVYSIMEEFFLKGNVPWYLDYEDLGKILDLAKYHADSDAGQNYAVIEALTAYVGRSSNNRAIQYRHSKKDQKSNVSFIGIYGNVFYAAPGTVNKLAGSYFDDGVVSALTQPSTEVSHVEKLLRA